MYTYKYLFFLFCLFLFSLVFRLFLVIFRLLQDDTNYDQQFGFEYRGPVVMKGKPEPMKVYYLNRANSISTPKWVTITAPFTFPAISNPSSLFLATIFRVSWPFRTSRFQFRGPLVFGASANVLRVFHLFLLGIHFTMFHDLKRFVGILWW